MVLLVLTREGRIWPLMLCSQHQAPWSSVNSGKRVSKLCTKCQAFVFILRLAPKIQNWWKCSCIAKRCTFLILKISVINVKIDLIDHLSSLLHALAGLEMMTGHEEHWTPGHSRRPGDRFSVQHQLACAVSGHNPFVDALLRLKVTPRSPVIYIWHLRSSSTQKYA